MIARGEIFTWKIGGVGGQGQQAAGATFAKACVRGGLTTINYSEFPSIIRGGHGTTQVSVARQQLTAPYRTVNLLVALNEETLQLHGGELSHDGVAIYDANKIEGDISRFGRRKHLGLPLQQLLQESNVPPISANMIAVGASFALLRFSRAVLTQAIHDQFADKGEAASATNVKAADVGYAYAVKHFQPQPFAYQLNATPVATRTPLMTGNDGVSLGIAAAGCQLYVAYPMSPSSSILHNLAAWATATGMVVRQPEDEIAGIHVAIGAMFAGTRAAIATSGGGFALMTEAVALSAMTETPLVCIVCSRPGPATGLPTWTEQGDLKFLVNSPHGDFPRVVLTPGDPAEAYAAAGLAFNLAERYQLPVFILMDKFVSETTRVWPDVTPKPPAIDRGKIAAATELAGVKGFKRFAFTADGVSPRALPGTIGGVHLANSDEHDEYGFAIESFGTGEEIRRRMVEKRAAKARHLIAALPKPVRLGPAKAKLTLLSWGSTKGVVEEALRSLPYVNAVHLPAVWPMPEQALRQLIGRAEQLVTVENNFTGQFATLLRGATGITPDHQLLKYNGQQFWPEELVEKVKSFL